MRLNFIRNQKGTLKKWGCKKKKGRCRWATVSLVFYSQWGGRVSSFRRRIIRAYQSAVTDFSEKSISPKAVSVILFAFAAACCFHCSHLFSSLNLHFIISWPYYSFCLDLHCSWLQKFRGLLHQLLLIRSLFFQNFALRLHIGQFLLHILCFLLLLFVCVCVCVNIMLHVLSV